MSVIIQMYTYSSNLNLKFKELAHVLWFFTHISIEHWPSILSTTFCLFLNYSGQPNQRQSLSVFPVGFFLSLKPKNDCWIIVELSWFMACCCSGYNPAFPSSISSVPCWSVRCLFTVVVFWLYYTPSGDSTVTLFPFLLMTVCGVLLKVVVNSSTFSCLTRTVSHIHVWVSYIPSLTCI